MALGIGVDYEQMPEQGTGVERVLGPFGIGEELSNPLSGVGIKRVNAWHSQITCPVGELAHESVVMVHIVHIGIRSIGGDAQFRVGSEHFLKLVVHREDASDYHSRTGINTCGVGKYLWEIVHHAPCNAPVLFGSERSQLAVASPGGIGNP